MEYLVGALGVVFIWVSGWLFWSTRPYAYGLGVSFILGALGVLGLVTGIQLIGAAVIFHVGAACG